MLEELLEHPFRSVGYLYFVVAGLFSIVIRFILCLFRAKAHTSGETAIENHNKFTYRQYLRQSFLSNGKAIEVDDYFLPLIIGYFELITFPILLEYKQISVLGGWLALKAIGSWNTKNSRTAYNRFILGNILSITFSYLLFAIFIR